MDLSSLRYKYLVLKLSGVIMLISKHSSPRVQVYTGRKSTMEFSHLLLVALVVCVNAIIGLALDNDLYLHGYVSQGYFLSTENNYPVPNTTSGSAEFSEVALNVYALPADKLTMGIQFIARDLGDDGNNAVYMDWAYGDYHWRDYLGFRFGKIKMPSGLYNYSRDVDMARTSILMPESVYTENWRDFTLAVEGMGFYGNRNIRGIGEFDYDIFGGSLNVPDVNSAYWLDQFTGSMTGYHHGLEIQQSDSSVSVNYVLDQAAGTSIQMPWVAGGGLFWNTPVSGLRLGATIMFGRYEINHSGTFTKISTPTDSTQEQSLENGFYKEQWCSDYELDCFSVEYALNRLTLVGEYARFIQKDPYNHISDGYYIQAGYQYNEKTSFSIYYSEYCNDTSDRSGNLFESIGLKKYFRWQKDLCISGRIDITENWLFKLEGHVMNGAALVKRIHNEGSWEDPGRLKENWMLFAAKTTFHF